MPFNTELTRRLGIRGKRNSGSAGAILEVQRNRA